MDKRRCGQLQDSRRRPAESVGSLCKARFGAPHNEIGARVTRWSSDVPRRIRQADLGRTRREMKKAPPVSRRGFSMLNVGGDLLSHTLASAVPSALEGLASGFGMGPGVPPPPTPPTTLSTYFPYSNTPPPHTKNRATMMLVVCSGSHSGCEQRCCGQALGLLVPVNSTPHRASIPGLSTPSSLGGLNHARVNEVVGDLILERASRLDAFSGYPFRT